MDTRSWMVVGLLSAGGCAPALNAPGEKSKTEPSSVTIPTAKSEDPYKFTDPRGRFSVNFPAMPVAIQPPPEVATQPDSPIHLAIWESRVQGTKYILSVSYAPTEFFDANDNLEQRAAGSNDNPHWRIVCRRDMTLDGQPSKFVEYAATDGKRASVTTTTRYQGTKVTMSVNGQSGLTRENDEVKAFIESLKFTR